jgi:hypothetical protein
MYRGPALLTLSFALVLTTACKSPEQKAAEDAAKQMQDASNKMAEATKNGTANAGDAMAAMGTAMGAAMSGANAGKKVETVDFHVLKDMLPASLGDLRRTDATGEKTAAMGMQISHADGTYSNDKGASITLKITDIGSLTGLAGMAAYAWSSTEIDRESDNGYEKTSTLNGYKSHEKYDKSSKSGEVSVLVGDRFVVEGSGNGVDMDALKSAVSKVDLGKLNGMKNEGVK